MKKDEKIYLNSYECAELINRSPGAVRNLVLRNRIPFRKPGGRLVFIKGEIIEWLEGPWSGFEIEKDVPIAPRTNTTYPFAEMSLGDSFFVPLNGVDPMRLSSRIKSAARHFARNKNIRFVVRYNKRQAGIRCWCCSLDDEVPQ